MANQFNRSDAFESRILKEIGGMMYLMCCTHGLDPIEVYKKKKELQERHTILLIVGTYTEFGLLATFILEDTEHEVKILTVEDALDKPVFAYVQNVSDEFCSEYGYVQVTMKDNLYIREY